MLRPSMNRPCCVLLIAAIGCLAAGCGDVANIALKGTLAKVVDSSSDEAIRSMFEQADAACPTRMDAYTTLESVKMIDDKRVEFRYKVSNEGKSLASRFNKQVLKKAAVAHMKGNAMAVAIAKRDLSIEHIYEDVFGGHILSYTINKQVLAGDLDAAGDKQTNSYEVRTVKAEAMQSADLASAEEAAAGDPSAAELDPDRPELPKPLPMEFKPNRTNRQPRGYPSKSFL